MSYIETAKKTFASYKALAEKAMLQMDDTAFAWQANEDSNSVVAIIQHLWGNMLSRWTDFLTTDGEKDWRQRDAEFENEPTTREAIMKKWEDGWACLFNTLNSMTDADLEKTIFIRNEGMTAIDAINRQIAHYSYHVGQIVYIAKLHATGGWNSLTIPRGKSKGWMPK